MHDRRESLLLNFSKNIINLKFKVARSNWIIPLLISLEKRDSNRSIRFSNQAWFPNPRTSRANQDRNRILIPLKRPSHSRRWRRLLAAISSPVLIASLPSSLKPVHGITRVVRTGRSTGSSYFLPPFLRNQREKQRVIDFPQADAMSVPLF